ncbi:hypothetical protein GQ53DRAFT_773774 [Thozetella sp. PMI_491]|nr:hypothetical protein GQ53DRAFT_773774 [Thozetella sp. PMI_491]
MVLAATESHNPYGNMQSSMMERRDAVSSITQIIKTLNSTVQAQISLIHERILDIQTATSSLGLAQDQGKINRNLDDIATAIQQAFLSFTLGNGIDLGADIAKNGTLSQDETTELIAAIGNAACILRDISDVLALTTSRLSGVVVNAFYDEISYIKSALVLFLLPVGGCVTAIQVAGAHGQNVNGTLQAISSFGTESQNLLGSRF